MRVKPQIVLPIANTVVTRLSSFVRQVDFALDWLFIESGRAVYRQVKNYFFIFIKIDNIYSVQQGKHTSGRPKFWFFCATLLG